MQHLEGALRGSTLAFLLGHDNPADITLVTPEIMVRLRASTYSARAFCRLLLVLRQDAQSHAISEYHQLEHLLGLGERPFFGRVGLDIAGPPA